MISSGRSAQDVVEVLSAFIISVQDDNRRVQLPLPRSEAMAAPAEEVAVAARL